MPASSNKRIFYPAHVVAVKPDSDANYTFGAEDALHGVQSVGITTNINLEPLFQLGVLEIYENVEDIPDVEVTLNKLLDGNPLILHKATEDATQPTLVGRSTCKCTFGAAIYSDTSLSASGTELSTLACSGMFVSSVSYTFGVDGSFTEDVTMVGNNKFWYNQASQDDIGTGNPQYGETDGKTLPSITWNAQLAPGESPLASVGIARGEDFMFEATGIKTLDSNRAINDADTTVLPPEVYGISNSGLNEKTNGADFDAHIQSITVSFDYGRESIDELGRRGPYHRNAAFPTEVSCEITAIATEGDLFSATEDGVFGTTSVGCGSTGRNVNNRTIRIASCDGTRIYLGRKNKLSSVNYSGGDTGGGNVTISYTFSTFNDCTVMHSQDPNSSYAWADRAAAGSGYLVE